MSESTKLWERNFKTAYERGVARGKEEVGEPNTDLLCDGLGNLFAEILGDLIVSDDADGIISLEMNFLEGYFDSIEKEEVLLRQVALPNIKDCIVILNSSSYSKYYGAFKTIVDAKEWIDQQPEEVQRSLMIVPLSRTDIVRSEMDFWMLDRLQKDDLW